MPGGTFPKPEDRCANYQKHAFLKKVLAETGALRIGILVRIGEAEHRPRRRAVEARPDAGREAGEGDPRQQDAPAATTRVATLTATAERKSSNWIPTAIAARIRTAIPRLTGRLVRVPGDGRPKGSPSTSRRAPAR